MRFVLTAMVVTVSRSSLAPIRIPTEGNREGETTKETEVLSQLDSVLWELGVLANFCVSEMLSLSSDIGQ